MKKSGLYGALLLLSACTTNSHDALERYNRTMYGWNMALDKAVLRPAAELYKKSLPTTVTTCAHGIFQNTTDGWSAINSALQGQILQFFNSTGRFFLNSTMGIGGCIDIASQRGVYSVPNDFGITLGVWGVPAGPYIMLPFFGPSTLRDTVGLIGDSVGTDKLRLSEWRLHPPAVGAGLYVWRQVDRRVQLLGSDALLNSIALDPYSFLRDAYLQKRTEMIRKQKGIVYNDSSGSAPIYDDPDADNQAATSSSGATATTPHTGSHVNSSVVDPSAIDAPVYEDPDQ